MSRFGNTTSGAFKLLSGGDDGIRTHDTLFKVCSFSKRVPSAARPRLHAPDMPDDAVTCKRDRRAATKTGLGLFFTRNKTAKGYRETVEPVQICSVAAVESQENRAV